MNGRGENPTKTRPLSVRYEIYGVEFVCPPEMLILVGSAKNCKYVSACVELGLAEFVCLSNIFMAAEIVHEIV